MKWLKKLFAILFLLIIVGVLAVVSLAIFIDPNQLRPVIIEEVKKRTGYQLQIDGQLTWSFYPRLGVKIEHMSLLAPPETAPFIDLRDVKIATELVQLLRGKGKLQGGIHIADGRLMNLHLQNADVKVGWQDNVLTIRSLRADLYEGTIIATAHGRELSATPRWDWDAQLDGVQVKPLLQDVNGADSKIRISGTGRIQLKGGTQGISREQILSNLNGSCDLNIENGSVEGMDLNYYVLAADSLINKQPMPPPPTLNQTSFSRLAAYVVIKNGVAETNNLLLTSPSFITKGTGRVYLVSQTINLQLQTSSQQAIKTQWEIPVMVTGNLSRPDVVLDASEIEKWVAREELEKVKTKASEIINKHIPGKAGEYLQNLLGK